MKVAASDEPFFASCLDANKELYDRFKAEQTDVYDLPQYWLGKTECFRPSATMLTSIKTSPDATSADIPVLDNQASLMAAIRSGHGKFIFSSDNQVLFTADRELPNGCDSLSFLLLTSNAQLVMSRDTRSALKRSVLGRLLKSKCA